MSFKTWLRFSFSELSLRQIKLSEMSSSVDILSDDSNVPNFPIDNDATTQDDDSKETETEPAISLDSPLSENEIASEVVDKSPAGNGLSNCAKLEVIKSSLLRPSVFAAALSGRGSRPPLLSSLTSATAGLLATVLSSNGKHHFYGLTKCEGRKDYT